MSGCDVSSFGGEFKSTKNKCTVPLEANQYRDDDAGVLIQIGDKVKLFSDKVYLVTGFRKSGHDVLADLSFSLNGSDLKKCCFAAVLEVVK